MPDNSRRPKIEAMLADDPTDRFLRYSLAMELEKEGKHDASLEVFATLTRESPPYVPAFLMAGQHLVQQGRVEEAARLLRDGIAASQAERNDHAAAEMSDLLASLG